MDAKPQTPETAENIEKLVAHHGAAVEQTLVDALTRIDDAIVALIGINGIDNVYRLSEMRDETIRLLVKVRGRPLADTPEQAKQERRRWEQVASDLGMRQDDPQATVAVPAE